MSSILRIVHMLQWKEYAPSGTKHCEKGVFARKEDAFTWAKDHNIVNPTICSFEIIGEFPN